MNKQQRWCWRMALGWTLAALLAACGGGGTEPVSKVPAAEGARREAANIVLRNDDRGLQLQGTFETVDGYLSNSRTVLRSAGSADARARFTTSLPLSGHYEVFAWWPEGAAASSRATIDVHHAEGSSSRQVDQSVLGGQWVSLGIHRFNRGGPAAVSLSPVAGAPMLVDAVRWHYVGQRRPPLSLAAAALAMADVGDPYTSTVRGWGGTEPYTYGIAHGRLPLGLGLDASSGTISGTPEAAGDHPFTLSVRDAAGTVATRVLSIPVVQSLQRPSTTLTAPFSPTASRKRIAAGGAPPPGGPDLGGLLDIVAGMPEGSWSKVNLNLYSDAWVPPELRNLYGAGNPTPHKVIAAWSSFAWDPNRGNLMLYGGGHANYRGNEVYIWRGATRQWERGSLPSAMVQDSLGNWNAVDSADRAPASAHTYDNTLFFPLLDRLVVLGGAADSNGGHYLRKDSETTSRRTGLYLFDPSRAHPDRVGGTTGSHVQRVAPFPDIVGGEMWSNRDMFINTVGTQPPTKTYSNGCTGQATESGRDVGFLRIADFVFRFKIGELDDPKTDTWEQVGRKWNGGENKASCAYDPTQKLLVRTATQTTPFVYWDLNDGKAGPKNNDAPFVPSDPAGSLLPLLASGDIKIRDCGLDHDPVRSQYLIWCDDGRVWSLKPPPSVTATGWAIGQQPTPLGATPNAPSSSGVLGKWKYIPNLDVFMGLQDSVQGNIWVYKPVGWQNPEPGNARPAVSITQPTDGARLPEGLPIEVAAEATDRDGVVQKVEFFHGATKFGEALSPPYTAIWNDAPAGTHTLTAVATDDQGATGSSATVTITVATDQPNVPPSVEWVQPFEAASFEFGTPIVLEVQATDEDGAVVRVEFFDGPRKLGEALTAPYAVTWSDATVGGHSLVAIATDDSGAQTVSDTLPISVTARDIGDPVTVSLQRRAAGDSVVLDTFLSRYSPDSATGGSQEAMLELGSYAVLVRFAVLQPEGGPVPPGAVIDSAVLSLYKFSGGQQTYGAHRLLEPWQENTASWNSRGPGLPWAEPGANGIGTDFAAAPDGVGAIGSSAGWVHIDVRAAVQAMSDGAMPIHHGWRIRPQLASSSLKRFRSSEYLAEPDMRPKLVITYR